MDTDLSSFRDLESRTTYLCEARATRTRRLMPVDIPSPCTLEALLAGDVFHPYPCEHTRYIRCDDAGNSWVQDCPAGMFFHPENLVCVFGDPQGHSGC
ncbi:hypothetical protein C0Q70_12613 [Pomacea canaliculata]|uniref:Chitin-binding type-2 domain-containing protein n=1 Tax=Pomacea canaliculata TaxID=400727 RepID=A0A2T7P238_POMCA|nr:hypothetical protein C0Q70_12613 [Pomacea canaliculata]